MQAITIAILAASIILAVCPGHEKDVSSRHAAAQQGSPGSTGSRNEQIPSSADGHASGANPSRLSRVHSHRSPSRSRAGGGPGTPPCSHVDEVNSGRGQSRGDVLEPPKVHDASANCTKILERATRCTQYSKGPFIYKFGSGPSEDKIDLCFKKSAGSLLKTAAISISVPSEGQKLYSYTKPVPVPRSTTSLARLRDDLLAGVNPIYNDTHKRLILRLGVQIDGGFFQGIGHLVNFVFSGEVEVAILTKNKGRYVLRRAAPYGYHTGDYFFGWNPLIPDDVVLFCLGEDINEPLVATILTSEYNSNIEYTGPGPATAQIGSLEELTDTFVSQKGYIYDKHGGILQPKIYFPG